MKEEKSEEKAEEKKEPEKNEEILVAPVAEQQQPIPPPFVISERDAKNLIFEVSDTCRCAEAAFNLPPTANISRSPNFYLNEIIRALKEYNIIE